jgi:hypothetical protein
MGCIVDSRRTQEVIATADLHVMNTIIPMGRVGSVREGGNCGRAVRSSRPRCCGRESWMLVGG